MVAAYNPDEYSMFSTYTLEEHREEEGCYSEEFIAAFNRFYRCKPRQLKNLARALEAACSGSGPQQARAVKRLNKYPYASHLEY